METTLQNTLKKLLSERVSLDLSLMARLPKSILQEAIQGKLVPQSSDDEPASFLLERIKQEKHKMLIEGKLKKKDIIDSIIFKGDDNKYYEKVGGMILDISEEISFEIPNSWQWVRLGTLFSHNTGKALNRADIDGIKKSGTYIIYSSTSREHLIRALDTKSNWQDIINNGKVNGVDLSSDIKNDTENVWAMGSPTLEMWVDSWNTMYPSDKLYTAKNTNMGDAIGWGFYVGANENPTSYYINLGAKEGYNNPLYYPHKSDVSNCYGYWLASPSAYASYVMFVACYGGVGASNYCLDNLSARPLVCLPSNILE